MSAPGFSSGWRAPGATGRLLGVVVALGFTACTASQRKLTPRQVEDPIVLPQTMKSAGTAVGVRRTSSLDWDVAENAAVRWGVTDRLEWNIPFGLRYAFLNDAPTSPRPEAPLSLAVEAGLRGWGVSSLDGVIAVPHVALLAAKHLGTRTLLRAGADWWTGWASHPTTFGAINDSPYVDPWYASRWESSVWSGSLSALFQLVGGVAAGAAGDVYQLNACRSGFCDALERGATGTLLVSLRPWSTVTLDLGPSWNVRTWRTSFVPAPDVVRPCTGRRHAPQPTGHLVWRVDARDGVLVTIRCPARD